MPDRFNELVRQRALVAEHLAWLDQEIARANSVPATAPAPLAPQAALPRAESAIPPITDAAALTRATNNVDPTASSPSSAPAMMPAETPAVVSDEILDQYRVSPTSVHQDVRKGCFLYFAGAFVLLGIVIAILYFTISSR
jgi:hypothetical protein